MGVILAIRMVVAENGGLLATDEGQGAAGCFWLTGEDFERILEWGFREVPVEIERLSEVAESFGLRAPGSEDIDEWSQFEPEAPDGRVVTFWI